MKVLCSSYGGLNDGGETNTDTDDVITSMRLCNMESLLAWGKKEKKRPFFGVVEFHQFNNVLKR